MSCNQELVSAFLDGELDTVILKKVTRHLLECNGCCQSLTSMAQASDSLREHYLIPDPEGFTLSVMNAISNEKVHRPRSLLRRKLVQYGLPAALITLLLSGLSDDALAEIEADFTDNPQQHQLVE